MITSKYLTGAEKMAVVMLISVALGCTGSYPQLGKDPLEDVIGALTLEEKVQLVHGAREPIGDSANTVVDRVPGSAGYTYPIPRLGIPSIVLADGPAGLRIQPKREGAAEQTYFATAFPIASLLASSWDQKLVEQVGTAIGAEAKEYGVDVLLAPGMNIHRFALAGRNFEYYSEDPLVSGKMAAAFVRGVQSQGIGTSLKHFVANNHDWNRGAMNVKVGERALREIYLRGFEIAVKDSSPWTIMSAYNQVNGVYASQNTKLLTDVLRQQWGFDGLVMTDWYAGTDAIQQMQAGNDLLMPGTVVQHETILQGVRDGELSEDILDRNVANVLRLVLRSQTFAGYSYSDTPDLNANAKIARMAATEGMVLLKNNAKTLPLAENKKIALFGNYSYDLVTGGTGSGDVNEAYSISMEQGLLDAGFQLDESLAQSYKQHVAAEKAKLPEPESIIETFMPKKPLPEMDVTKQTIEAMAENFDVAVITIGRSSGEFADRKEDDFYLNEKEVALLERVTTIFHNNNKSVIAVLNIGGAIELASWRDQVDAMLLAYQPGQEAGHAIADVLAGEVNPSGKLIDTLPIDLHDYPSAKGFPGTVIDDTPQPFGSLDLYSLPSEIEYDEGIWLGYRFFNTENKPVAYPFGFGLSYTEFVYDDFAISDEVFTGEVTVQVTIKNTGETAGREVVQLYLSAPKNELVKPAEELRAFAKTKLLASGESQTLSFTLSADDLVSVDESRNQWIVAAGDYKVNIGASSRDFRGQLRFVVRDNQYIQL